MGTLCVEQQHLLDENDSLHHVEQTDPERHLVLVFGSTERLEDGSLVGKIQESHPGALLAGCTTAGEVTGSGVSDQSVTVSSLRFGNTRIRTRRVTVPSMDDSLTAGRSLAEALREEDLSYLMILSDGLNVNGSLLVEGLHAALPAGVPFSGGLAGDGARFQKTLTLDDQGIHERSIVGIGFYGNSLKVNCGSVGGWAPFGTLKTVTRTHHNVVYEIDGNRALDVYSAYLGDEAKDLPASGLLFPLSMASGAEENGLIRTLLAIDREKGSLTFAGDIPEGSNVQLMHANYEQLVAGAQSAAEVCLADDGGEVDFTLMISCVGRKLMMGNSTDLEVEAVMERVGQNSISAGFYSYGEIGPFAASGSSELHNQTMTVTTFREKTAC
ncbi:MAG: FIST C-terminal domain-containing protein [Phycisphaerae bacterium]|nr:FIST C-terminal domain-containing protein [Phycisphaerae bacterium]